MEIIVLDTGCANLSSITIAINKLGYKTRVTSDPFLVQSAHKIIIPGVGTASAAMKTLLNKKLVKMIQTTNKPVLGICLGMQLLCSFSEEGKGVQTLGIIPSTVSLLQTYHLPLPHIGWNQIIFETDHVLLKNIPTGSRFYFVHSYFIPINMYTLSISNYGVSFSSIIQKNNFFGVQFHPEKSGNSGSQILKNFIEM